MTGREITTYSFVILRESGVSSARKRFLLVFTIQLRISAAAPLGSRLRGSDEREIATEREKLRERRHQILIVYLPQSPPPLYTHATSHDQ